MGPLAQLPVCDIVDLLLLALVRHKASAVTIEPAGNGHAIRYERGTSTVTLETLTPERGDAVVMRLAIVFGIAVGSSEEQIGRLRIRGRRRGSDPDLPAPPATEILVAIRPTASGLSAELHRFAGPEDQVPGGELVPVASDSGPEDNRRIGPYRISTELGRGSMGIVYRAEHLVLQKAVAIKILHPGMAGDPEAAARFIMEARAACRARHPGIVDVTDFGRLPGGRAFLVMELVEGPTLEVVLQSGPLAPARAIRIAAAVAEALRAASAHCVVHRDLKPANIFIGHEDHVKIGDFGVAKVLEGRIAASDNSVSSDGIIGTAWYMSPEQARGVDSDFRSDLYSLGCVLFEMLTGAVPFDGKTLGEVLEQQISAPTPPLRGPGGPFPAVIERVVLRAMAKRPEERYQSADELLKDLERASRAVSRSDWRRWLPL
ncbi:MAG TPA: serine/threonine-protein kinase [Burkholderiaceae bacterium]|nr:serine/threonine-protein kinase [Burkholderiaceae bacterium]